MSTIETIDAATLSDWLEAGKRINILDVRPSNERGEWLIPGSIHVNVYDKLKAKDANALNGIFLDRNVPVVTVCAGGRISRIAAEILKEQGFKTYSLEDGMKGWSLSWNTARLRFPDFEVVQVRRTGKGCLSYIIISDSEAVVVDASLSADVYEEILWQNSAMLKYVIETHLHADHLSRSRLLAERNNAPLYLPAPNKAQFAFYPIDDTTSFKVGTIFIKAISTPGHTLESTSFIINQEVLLTGDTLFINGVGRPDLKANTEEAILKSGLLYQSLQKLLALDDNIIVLPSHTNQPVDFDHKPVQATLSDIKHNVAMLHLTEEEFTTRLLQNIPPTPANYLAIIEKNIKGDFSDIDPTDLEAGANRCAVS